jgi:hypothetical protein
MKQVEYIEVVKRMYPSAKVKKEGYDRYGIYQDNKRIDGWSCMSELTAWKSAYNVIIKEQKDGTE